MSSHSINPEPIKSKWMKRKDFPGHQLKEIAGVKSLFHWHCGYRMIRIIEHEKSDEGVRRVGCTGWICQVCEKRENNDDV